MKNKTKLVFDNCLSNTSKMVMAYFVLEGIDKIEISIDDLRNMFGLSRKTIVKVMKELEQENFIEKIKRGQGKNNIYIIKGSE